MSLCYYEIIEQTVPKLRPHITEILNTNTDFARLNMIVNNPRDNNASFSTIINTFAYYNIDLQYQEDIYERVKELDDYERGYEIKRNLTKLRRTSPERILIFVLNLKNVHKSKMYFLLRELFLKCMRVEFKWCMKLLCNKSQVKAMIGGR